MDKKKLPALGAMVLFVTAWFLPVEKDAAVLSDGSLPGYQAFRVAIDPVLQHRLVELDLITVRELLCAMSALTNLLIPFTLFLVLRWPRASWATPRAMSTVLLFAFLINAQWIWPRGEEFLDLRAGYWLWSASFGILAIALRRLYRQKDGAADRRSAERRGTAPPAPPAPSAA